MNKQGVFITFMVFLLATSVLALHEATKETDFRQESKNINDAAFDRVNNTFNNIYEEVVSLNKEGLAKTVQQRAMPFQYSFQENGITLSQELPARESLLRAYIDALNIYSIYANEDPESDLTITTSTIQDYRWDDTQPEYPNLDYVILPQCLRYRVNNGPIMALESFTEDECTGFDYADLNSIDINVTINTSTYEAYTPAITGTLSGNATYDPINPDPYVYITINERNRNCPGVVQPAPGGCMITDATGIEIISTHFDPDEDTIDWLLIKTYKNTELKEMRIKVGKEFLGDTTPVKIESEFPVVVDIDLTVTFEQPIDLFYFTGFDISVEKPGFLIKRST